MRAVRCLLCLALALSTQQLFAVITPVILTSDAVPGLPGESFVRLDSAQINASGKIVFFGAIEDTPTNEYRALFSYEGGNALLFGVVDEIAVPNAPGAKFSNAYYQLIDDVGNLSIRGQLSIGLGGVQSEESEGIWHFGSGGNSTIARAGVSTVPGVAAAKFKSFSFAPDQAGNGHLAFQGFLAAGGGGVTNLNDTGIWKYNATGGTLSLVVRESTAAPEVPLGTFASFDVPEISANDRVVVKATLKLENNVTQTNRLGIWQYDNGVGTLLARTGTPAPGLAGNFAELYEHRLNNAGDVAILGKTVSGVTGLWRHSNGSVDLLASTESPVPDVPGATFELIDRHAINDAGDVIALAFADIAGYGVWSLSNDENRLLLGANSTVPGIPGADFSSIIDFASNPGDQVFVHGSLDHGIGGVNTTNDEGIWRVSTAGDAELVARKGDLLAGQTIESLSFPGLPNVELSSGLSNAAGQLVFHATFTNGEEGIFLYSPETSTVFSPADFNLDGYVDATDLATWQGAYKTSAAGDADRDGDTDGTDFLIWQREFTGPPTSLDALAVPEPSVCWLLMMALGFSQRRIALRAPR